jgi:uncharacterized protein (UPF0335 family)
LQEYNPVSKVDLAQLHSDAIKEIEKLNKENAMLRQNVYELYDTVSNLKMANLQAAKNV